MKRIGRLAVAWTCSRAPFTPNRIYSNKTQTMGSDATTTHLQQVSRLLMEFERAPKVIDGNRIAEWFNIGEDLFTELYKLGCSAQWSAANLSARPELVAEVAERVVRNGGWLQSFLSVYPALRVEPGGAGAAAAVCRVRSGLELLLRALAGRDARLDAALAELRLLGEVDEFDDRLRVWCAGHRPDYYPGELRADTPRDHWWWH